MKSKYRKLLVGSFAVCTCALYLCSCSDDSNATVASPLECLLQQGGKISGAEELAMRAGYEGQGMSSEVQNSMKLVSAYCAGAALGGHEANVQLSIEKGASPFSAMVGAAAGGHMEIVQSVLPKVAKPHRLGRAIEFAAMFGHVEIVQLLLEKGNDADSGLEGAARGNQKEIIQMLLTKGANPDYGMSGAAEGGHMDIVQYMLEKGASPDRGVGGAAKFGHMDIVQFLLEKGDVKTDYYDIAPCVENGYMEIAELLLKKTKRLEEDLISAAQFRNAKMLQLILSQPGIDVNYVTYLGEYKTALDVAEESSSGDSGCVEMIRAAGGKRRCELDN